MYDELVKRLREHNGWALNETLDQAADAIEELQATVEGYKSSTNMVFVEKDGETVIEFVPRWIPVTERLPKEGEFVLVHGNLYPNKHDGGVIAVSKRMDWNYWQGFGRERNITHWMPLPQPPKEET